MRAEIEYLADMFCDNAYDRKSLQKIINNSEKKTRSINNGNNNNTDNNINCLSLHTKNRIKNQKRNTKFESRLTFQTGPNLKNILCKNKS